MLIWAGATAGVEMAAGVVEASVAKAGVPRAGVEEAGVATNDAAKG